MKYFVLLLGILFLILSCSRPNNNVLVRWSPDELHPGDEVEIIYNYTHPEARFTSGQNVQIVYESIFPESTSVKIMTMEKKENHFSRKMVVPSGAKLVGFKFEAENGITEDNERHGWNAFVYSSDGQVQRDNHYFLGKVYDGRLRAGANTSLENALDYYKKEIQLFPDNYKVWYSIWQCKLLMADDKSQFLQVVQNQLDSLLSAKSNNESILKLAFDTYRTLIYNRPKAEYFGTRFLSEFPRSSDAAKISYFMIFLSEKNSGEQVEDKIAELLKKYPDFTEKSFAYKNLLNYYRRSKEQQKLFNTLNELIQIDPSDFSNYVACARQLTYTGQLKDAESYINLAFEQCTLENSRKRSPWIDGFERVIQYNIDLASIHSTLALINFQANDFDESIKNRKKAIELGSPFPAFEWQHIGEAYYKMGKIESAKHAYAASLLKSPTQDGAKQGLYQIYNENEGGARDNFETYVQNILMIHQKEFSKPAPDFRVRDLEDKYRNLSEEKGNILVLYFGATVLWEKTNILEKLNRLAGKYKNHKDIQFWVIAIESKNRVSPFFNSDLNRLKVFHGGESAKEKMAVQGFPTYIIIDREGIEQFRQVGESIEIEKILEAQINKILKDKIS